MDKEKQKYKRLKESEIVVVGGGLAGTAAALSLANAGFRIIHLAPNAPKDKRTSALMGPSIDFLLSTGLISNVEKIGTPLTKIRLIDATDRLIRSPEALFDAQEAGYKNFGYNFANSSLLASFMRKGKKLKNYVRISSYFEKLNYDGKYYTIQTSDKTKIKTLLIIGADGKNSAIRKAANIEIKKQNYKQSALVCDLKLSKPLNETSVEFHHKQGPFTLVPAGGNIANLVWIDDNEKLQQLKTKNKLILEKEFIKYSQNLFGNIELISDIFIFPLSSFRAKILGKNGIILLGEAAHGFPPVGAQGLNLSLRDIISLLDILEKTNKNHREWAKIISQKYATIRQKDLIGTIFVVDSLFKSLLADFLPIQAIRAGGIWMLKELPILRKKIFSLGIGKR